MTHLRRGVCALGLLLLAGCGEDKTNESNAEIKGQAPPPVAESGIDRTNEKTYAESMKTKMGNPYAQGGYPGANRRPQ